MPHSPLYLSKYQVMSISCELWAAIATNKYVVWQPLGYDGYLSGTCIPAPHFRTRLLLSRERRKILGCEDLHEAHLRYSE
jgi:hypothetical protein